MNRNAPSVSRPKTTTSKPNLRFELAAFLDISKSVSSGQPALAVCFAAPVRREVQDRFASALRFLQENEPLRAIAALDGLIRDEPGLSDEAHSLATTLQAVAWFGLGEWDRAEVLAKEALARWENQLDAYAVLFSVALVRGDEPMTTTQAHCYLFLYQKWLSHHEGPTTWFSLSASRAWFVELTIAQTLTREGETDKARPWQVKAQEHGIDDPRYYLVAALDCIRRGEPETGRALLLRGSARFPKDRHFPVLALKVLDRQENAEELDLFLQQWRGQSKAGANAEMILELADLKLERQEGRAAFRVLMSLPEKEHDTVAWQFLAGKAMEQMGDALAAEQFFERVLALEPSHAEATLLLANLHQRRGTLREALALLSETLEAQGEGRSPVLWVFLALHRVWLEENPDAWMEPIARLSLDLGLAPVERHAQDEPDGFRERWQVRLRALVESLAAIGEDVASMLLLRLMLELKLAHKTVWRDLGDVSLRLNQPELATRYLERAAQEEPGTVEIWQSLATLYEQLGHEDNAELCRRKVDALGPPDKGFRIKGPTLH